MIVVMGMTNSLMGICFKIMIVADMTNKKERFLKMGYPVGAGYDEQFDDAVSK